MGLPRRVGVRRPAERLPLRAQARGGRWATDLCGHRATDHIARSIPTAVGLDSALTLRPPQLALSPALALEERADHRDQPIGAVQNRTAGWDEVHGAWKHGELRLRESGQIPHH